MAKTRITKRSLHPAKAPETRCEMPKLAHAPVDELELASAREKILEQKYEIEELRLLRRTSKSGTLRLLCH
jgi:hypothetical protein